MVVSKAHIARVKRNKQQNNVDQSNTVTATPASKSNRLAYILILLLFCILIALIVLIKFMVVDQIWRTTSDVNTSPAPVPVDNVVDTSTPTQYSTVGLTGDQILIISTIAIFTGFIYMAKRLTVHEYIMSRDKGWYEQIKQFNLRSLPWFFEQSFLVLPLFLAFGVLLIGFVVSILKPSLRTPTYYYYLFNIALLPCYASLYILWMGTTAMKSGLYAILSALVSSLSILIPNGIKPTAEEIENMKTNIEREGQAKLDQERSIRLALAHAAVLAEAGNEWGEQLRDIQEGIPRLDLPDRLDIHVQGIPGSGLGSFLQLASGAP